MNQRQSFDFKPIRSSSNRQSLVLNSHETTQLLCLKNIPSAEYEQIKIEADYRQRFSRPTTSKVSQDNFISQNSTN